MRNRFPSHVLPGAYRKLIEESATAIGCDSSYVALPVLTAIAGAIGNSRVVQLKTGWTEPSVLWTGLVGPPGTAKSPALKEGIKPLADHQQHLWNSGKTLGRVSCCEGATGNGRVATKSDGPSHAFRRTHRILVSDTTLAGLSEVLAANTRGVVLVRDELTGWIEGFNSRFGGSQWLSIHDADSIIVDRARTKELIIPRAAVSICGGIQPGVLQRELLCKKNRENGLAARFLFASPEIRPVQWNETTTRVEVRAKYASALTRLFELAPTVSREDSFEPQVLRLTPDAKNAFRDFYNRQAATQHRLSANLAATWPKLRAYAGRLAMLLELAAWSVTDCSKPPELVSEQAMTGAAKLAEWFGEEAARIYELVDDQAENGVVLKTVKLIEGRGGSVTPRELCQFDRSCHNTEAAERRLQELRELGWGAWEVVLPKKSGGRPSRRFVLNVYKTSTISDE